MALGWIIDPGSAQFDLNDLSSTFVRAMACPMPAPQAQYVSAVDVDGDSLYSQRYGNRQITLTVEVKGTSASDLETHLGYLHQKVASINREAVLSRTGIGGSLQYTSPSTKAVTFDVCSVSATPDLSETYFFGHLVMVTLTFDCLPYWRAAEVTLSDHAETTLPVLVFTETGIAGDALALGRLVITEAQGADQWWLTWGVQSRYYDSSADAALFYQAEGRTRLGASTTAGTSGASASIAVRSAALTTSYVAILGTQATGAGNHLSHVGEFRVYARVQTLAANTGALTLALQWAQGDFLRPTQNATTTFPADSYDGTWRLVDLGLVSLTTVTQGTQRWEGRILAASTAPGDKVDVDHLFFVPVAEGSGTVSASTPPAAPTSLSASDDFAQTSGALNGKTLPIGGTWATSGSTTDLTVSGSGTVTRATTSDASPRFAVAGTTTFTGVDAQVDVTASGHPRSGAFGLLLRWTDSSNYAAAITRRSAANGSTYYLEVRVVVGGVTTTYTSTGSTTISSGALATLRATVDTGGRFELKTAGVTFTGSDANLATGGTLASGKTGLYDFNSLGDASTRSYDNFWAAVVVGDAAMFASQSCELRSDRFTREDSAGAVWVDKTIQGDFLTIPPAGREGRTLRMILKGSRNIPGDGADSAIDDISAQLFVTPRGLLLPE